MKKNQQLFSAETLFALLAFFMITAGCKKTDMSAPSLSSSSNDEAVSLGGYQQVNLVANTTSFGAERFDPRLQNAWGLSADDEGESWVSANETGLSFVYDITGAHLMPPITIPSHNPKMHGNPTGNIYNDTKSFMIPGTGEPSEFIFADEGGTVSAWNDPTGTTAVVVADRSGFDAVYKGLAIAQDYGENFLYVTNFSQGKIDVFDRHFNYVTNKPFKDPTLPKGYAPFNIRNIDGMLYVTFALQKASKEDDSAGVGHGFVDIFKPDGSMVTRFASRGKLDSPWGISKGKSSFLKDGAGDILIGNFGDGRINVFDREGKFLGQLMNNGSPVVIDGLWGLDNDIPGIGSNQLYFTAGPDDESDGLFGYLMKK